MLEQLFGSKTRAKLLYLFLKNPGQEYYVRELMRQVGAQLNSIRRELKNLEEFGFVVSILAPEEEKVKAKEATKKKATKKVSKTTRGQKKYYRLNDHFILFPELKALFLKSEMLVEQALVKKILDMGKIKYLCLTGSFVGLEDESTDLFIVGQINKKKFESLIKKYQKDMDQEINYTIMTTSEFEYRRGITDRFLYGILENKKIVVCDEFMGEQDADWLT